MNLAVRAKITRPEEASVLWGGAVLEAKRDALRQHQARYAQRRQSWIDRNRYYYDRVAGLLRFIIEPNRRVLSMRCQTGFFLGAVQPSHGVGVEITSQLAEVASRSHPELKFIVADPERLNVHERFDYILFDQISDTVDVLSALQRLHELCEPHTRLVIYTYNHLWQLVVELAQRVGLKMAMLEQNWLSEADVCNLLRLAGFEWLHTYRTILLPKRIPFVSEFVNEVIAKLPGIRRLCLVNVLIARPAPRPRDPSTLSVSVVVPCKNESGNIEWAVNRIPDMGRHTEILFCDDQSTDGTGDEVRRIQLLRPDRDIKLIEGPGICKSRNVWAGFNAASGDVLMILDADLSVMPEELPYFFEAITSGRGEFINGSRMVYPRQKMAMKPANMVGNKLFNMVFSYLLNQTVKDTLCGTKVLWRRDWERMTPLLGSWGTEDRWGDYELLFGAAKLHLRIVDLPVHYQERIYGTTKMVRVFRNGLIMLRMCLTGFLKLKGGF